MARVGLVLLVLVVKCHAETDDQDAITTTTTTNASPRGDKVVEKDDDDVSLSYVKRLELFVIVSERTEGHASNEKMNDAEMVAMKQNNPVVRQIKSKGAARYLKELEAEMKDSEDNSDSGNDSSDDDEKCDETKRKPPCSGEEVSAELPSLGPRIESVFSTSELSRKQ